MAQTALQSNAVQDAAKWGIDLLPEDLDSGFEMGVWADNLPAAEAFLAIASQWRMLESFEHGRQAVGLDYSGAEAGLRLSGIETTPELWSQLQLIEIGARNAINGSAP